MQSLLRFVILSTTLLACAPVKDDGKGVVDDSQPPAIPTEGGKADSSEKLVALNAQSAHPYSNNLDKVFSVSLAMLPSCAKNARLHFRLLRTEPSFDFVTVEPVGGATQSFDGNHDNLWTDFFALHADHVNVRLDTDGSITRHGFEIDQVEWDGVADGCPLVRFPPCAAGTVDLAKRPGTCECPAIPQCEPVAQVEVHFFTRIGRNATAKHAVGTVASETHPGLDDGGVTTTVGSIDPVRLAALVRRAAESGLLASAGYDHPIANGVRRDEFEIKAGAFDVHFVSGEGTHSPEIVALISELEALFSCDGAGGTTCNSGFSCLEGACVADQGCVCADVFEPVCGTNGQTYSNACVAACATADVGHLGECGIPGDSCGTIFGLGCNEGLRCRYDVSTFDAPFPDAGGKCVGATYCDAAADCAEMIHPAVPGAWACETHACGWKAGSQWHAFATGRFETTHPYANGTSVWKEVYLPAEAQALRLVAASFRTERNYDFLEVWSYKNGAWVLDRRYTGSAGPLATDELAGRFHYLRFVSDSSVTDQGFRVDAEWR